MISEEIKQLIDLAAEKSAKQTLNLLKNTGRIRHYPTDSFNKTVELLKLYPKLPADNPMKAKIEAALDTIRDDDYFGVIESLYFDKLTIVEISDIYDCKYQNISKKRNKLVKALANELFPEDVLKELLDQ